MENIDCFLLIYRNFDLLYLILTLGFFYIKLTNCKENVVSLSLLLLHLIKCYYANVS